MSTMQVTYEYFGEMKTYDLVPGGGDIPVTNDNRERYLCKKDVVRCLCIFSSIEDIYYIHRQVTVQYFHVPCSAC